MSEPLPPLVAQRDATHTIYLQLRGLSDEMSALRAREVLESVPGVDDAQVDRVRGEATIWLRSEPQHPQILIDALTAAGFGAGLLDVEREKEGFWSRVSNWWSKRRLRWPQRSFLTRLAGVVLLTMIIVPPIWVAFYAFLPVPITPLMVERWIGGAAVNHEWRSFEKLSPRLVDAVIAGEDTKFCGHNGFDWDAIDSAIASNDKGHTIRGASTISMQVAKNAFLWPERSWLRKGIEAYFTMLVETMWSKQRIMTVYLNVAEWGDGIYGAEAASRFYFKKPASALTTQEASLLAAVLPNPREWHAYPAGPYVQSRSAVLLGRMNSVVAQGLSACVRN